jgi:hypothetical protein
MSAGWIKSLGLFLLLAVATRAEPPATDERVLIVQYLRFALAGQVGQQMAQLAEGQDEGRRAELRRVSDDWQAGRKGSIRAELQKHFGPQGRTRFEAFVNEWMRAEGTRDADVLRRYVAAFSFDPPGPASFADLRSRVLQDHLGPDMQDASALLARAQSWVESPAGGSLAARVADMGGKTANARPAARNPLREEEGGTQDWQAPGEEEGSPLDAFGKARQERRERALEEAQAGMQQVAEERRAAEEEYAQKKMAEAQADAEAVKRQADRLAATEQEALEQRQKSWGNRLKSIVGATLSAATGAFTGGIGTRAGQEAASALFD